MFHRLCHVVLAWFLLFTASFAQAQEEVKTDSPSINAIKRSLSDRFAVMKVYLETGQVGFTHDGFVAMRVPPLGTEARQALERLVSDDNKDRETLIREIARANGRTDWEDALRVTFAERWRAQAQPGWWLRAKNGEWSRK